MLRKVIAVALVFLMAFGIAGWVIPAHDALANVSIGEIIQFGGRDWRVLDVEGNYALILHETVITNQPYHRTQEGATRDGLPGGEVHIIESDFEQEGPTWETSTARQWLNGEFFGSFSVADHARIRETYVINNDNPWPWPVGRYGSFPDAPGGSNTMDRVFLLSIDEVLRYFGDSGMVARGIDVNVRMEGGDWPTPPPGIYFWGIHDQYSAARIAYNPDGVSSWWWLRSPGIAPSAAAAVYLGGRLGVSGRHVLDSMDNGGLRPALWLRFESAEPDSMPVTAPIPAPAPPQPATPAPALRDALIAYRDFLLSPLETDIADRIDMHWAFEQGLSRDPNYWLHSQAGLFDFDGDGVPELLFGHGFGVNVTRVVAVVGFFNELSLLPWTTVGGDVLGNVGHIGGYGGNFNLLNVLVAVCSYGRNYLVRSVGRNIGFPYHLGYEITSTYNTFRGGTWVQVLETGVTTESVRAAGGYEQNYVPGSFYVNGTSVTETEFMNAPSSHLNITEYVEIEEGFFRDGFESSGITMRTIGTVSDVLAEIDRLLAGETPAGEAPPVTPQVAPVPPEPEAPPASEPEQPQFLPSPSTDLPLEVFSVISPEVLDGVTDTAVAVEAVRNALIVANAPAVIAHGLIEFFADHAIANAASTAIAGSNVEVSASTIEPLQVIALETRAAMYAMFRAEGYTPRRPLNAGVSFVLNTNTANIQVETSAARTQAEQVHIRTPQFELAFPRNFIANNVADAPLSVNVEAPAPFRVNFSRPLNATVRLAVPPRPGDTRYQTLENSAGDAIGGKHNPATGLLQARISSSDTFTVVENRIDFTDIQHLHAEMQNAIRLLASQGAISGTGAGQFSPGDSTNRAHLATIVMRMLGLLDPNADGGFNDVARADWFFGAAGSANRHGIMSGTGAGQFSPVVVLPRDQLTAVAARVLRNEMNYSTPAAPSNYLQIFTDRNDFADWSVDDLALAARESLISLRGDGQFRPRESMTRGDVALMLYRLHLLLW